MPHIYSFIKALKISWLRRVIQQANNTTWHILNPIDFDSFIVRGRICKELSNQSKKPILERRFDQLG